MVYRLNDRGQIGVERQWDFLLNILRVWNYEYKKIIVAGLTILTTCICAYAQDISKRNTISLSGSSQENNRPLYKDSSVPIGIRVKDLLDRMTLREKIAQLSQIQQYQIFSEQQLDPKKLKEVAGNTSYGFVEGFTLSGLNCMRSMYDIQAYMVDSTRLGIPIMTITESLHGSVQDGSTIFPQSVAIGSTFNSKLAYDMTSCISNELKLQGIWQTLSPGMDVVRDLRWGRVEESFGEDPYLVGKMGIAQVKGYLDHGISPMLKPFGADGAPTGGLNLASVECGEREMREIYLKPYKMTIKSTGVMALMSSYSSWNRVPNSASYFLLTDILRKEWGFKGYVYSDWGAVKMLQTFQHTAKNDADAAKQALMAGIDVEAASNCFEKLPEVVKKREVDVKYIDQAVRRVLYTKFKLGLFDSPFRGISDTSDYLQKVHTPEAIKLSRKIADESIVLLKNKEGLLPLNPSKIESIAVIGPNADQVQFGDYTWSRNNNDGITPLEGIKKIFNRQINYAKGCDLVTDDSSGFKPAVNAAKKSDVSIVFVGSASASLGRNYSDVTSGEGFDLAGLMLTGVQAELIKAIYAVGKPVIVVLVTGKPFAIPWAKQHIPAIIVQWYGGECGGDAIANMLFGKINPSGKLPFSFPQSVGHLPVYYNYLPTDKGYYHKPGSPKQTGRDYVFSSPKPLWAFGYGLSYTTFKYLNAELSSKTLLFADTLKVKVKIYNAGMRDGKEVVQLYVRDMLSSVVTPVKQLKAFAKPFIKAGDTATVILKLPVTDLAFYNLEMKDVIEPGNFEIQIGSASDDIKFNKVITVIDSLQSSVKKMKMDLGETKKKEGYISTSSQKIITVSGYVRDVQATPIAHVKVHATKSGKESKTDSNGKYIINALANDTLIFSVSGYEEIVIKIKNQKSINISLNREQD